MLPPEAAWLLNLTSKLREDLTLNCVRSVHLGLHLHCTCFDLLQCGTRPSKPGAVVGYISLRILVGRCKTTSPRVAM